MEAILKKICTTLKNQNALYTRDWDQTPLPSLPREGKHFAADPPFSVLTKKFM
jgi:hypothetical protein